MEKIFTSEEVKNVIADSNTILEHLKKDILFEHEVKEYIQDIATKPCYEEFCQREILDALQTKECAFHYSEETLDLMRALVKYRLSQKIVVECRKLFDTHIHDIMKYISNLKQASSGVKWFFASSRKKHEAVTAYRYLTDISQGKFYLDYLQCHDKLVELNDLADSEVIRLFNDKQKQYQILLQSINSALFISCDLDVIKELIYGIKSVEQVRTEVKNRYETYSNTIRYNADKLLDILTREELENIPVQELNRDKSGIRISLLMSNGIKSIADVLKNQKKLNTIKGISDDGARIIIDHAYVIYDRVKKNQRIKINYDKRNDFAEKILNCVHSYLQLCGKADAFVKEFSKYEKTISDGVEHLLSIGAGIAWIFADEQERTQFVKAYDDLQTIVKGQLPQIAHEVHDLLNRGSFIAKDALWEDFKDNSIEYYNSIEHFAPGLIEESSDVEYLDELEGDIDSVPIESAGLLCKLRRYQEFGVKFLLHQRKILLGDEMGLGKTIQSIAAMVSINNSGGTHFLVVSPASVLMNWCREIRKHSTFEPYCIWGSERRQNYLAWKKTGGVAVVTYETLDYLDLNSMCAIDLLTVDEAHYVKNSKAIRTMNTGRLCKVSKNILFMTGTALENRVEEMINLIRMLNPNIANEISNLSYTCSSSEFRKKVAPVYLRRRQEDVNQELPDKIEYNEFCIMHPEERDDYENAILDRKYMQARRLSWMSARWTVSCKLNRLSEIIELAKEEKRKVIVYSFFLDTINLVREVFSDICTEPINGAVLPAKRQQIIDDFTSNPNLMVLPAQIVSGGTGLNIQAGSVVVICEPQFKPSIENQAIARAHRMGQSRTVMVYHLLCEDTIDERLLDVLRSKQEIFDEYADKSVSADREKEEVEVDDKGWNCIIEEETKRIKEKHSLFPQNEKTIIADKG